VNGERLRVAAAEGPYFAGFELDAHGKLANVGTPGLAADFSTASLSQCVMMLPLTFSAPARTPGAVIAGV
jgi:hypothetical protein